MPVPQHRRLGLRRRPAGEQQHGDLFGVDEGMLPGHRLGDGRRELALRHDVAPRRRPGAASTSSSSAIIRPPATRPRIPASCSSGAR